MSDDRVCIIGAGAAGLGAMEVLQREGIAFDCFEQTDRIGGHWHTILWATGFKVSLPFLDPALLRWRDRRPLRTAGLTLPVGAENLYFVGLAAPRGPQLPVYSAQAELVVRMLLLDRDQRSALAARFAETDVPDDRIDIVRAIWQRQMRDAHRLLDRAARPEPVAR